MPAECASAVAVESDRVLGVLGGMGPLATADFLRKLVSSTPARSDQEHIRTIVLNDPTVPDRTEALETGRGTAVLEALERGIARLAAAGATAAVMPCNTAHAWFDDLQQRSPIPLLHIVDAALEKLSSLVERGARVAVLATPGTTRAGIYVTRLREAGYVVVPLGEPIERAVYEVISAVKAGRVDDGRRALGSVIDTLRGTDVDAILLACTELPLALSEKHVGDARIIDVTQALVDACIAWSRGR